ncbi:MAG: type IX secretion system plug protein domain-containing protein [Flavobacteriaceae bacterium]
MRNLKLFIITLFVPLILTAQVQEVDPPMDIKTISLGVVDNASGLAIINLNDRLVLEFDVLNNLEEDFYYVIEHFDSDWNPSQLMKTEYLAGMDNLRIVDYVNSFNTYQIYSHYRLQIPNRQTRLKVSGNYIIKIFDDYDHLVFSRKFMVVEPMANVAVQIRRSRDVALINETQSVDFNVTPSTSNFNNPLETIKTTVLQNNNLKTAVHGLKPQYIRGNQLVYRYTNASLFWGGNEYLFFENKDIRATNLGIQYIDLQDLYHSYLYTNIERSRLKYTFNPDINGGFKVTVLDREDPRIEADYTYVHFSLSAREFIDATVYVYGGFNNFSTSKENEMVFNPKKGVYEATLLLKQGFYNYKYVLIDKENTLHEGAISGNFDETENNYKVLVYYRDLGARYDKLIGLGEANSVQMTN